MGGTPFSIQMQLGKFRYEYPGVVLDSSNDFLLNFFHIFFKYKLDIPVQCCRDEHDRQQ
jgi:hypothetical protein